ncbi:zeta toxin family protein [Bilifractor sp. LCP19S3_H10]|uniref:zeta toxin family protein n=1 Tax=Bilifractor sp. LCP19S3_H10 TaxID=3438736 RepID=UPI003F8DECB1
MFNFEENDYTQQQFREAYSEVKETVTAGIVPESRKCTIILGGQPGAGKSSFYQSRDDLVSYAAINGDEYRRFHPMIQGILKSDPEHYAERTQKFSNQMVETLISDLSNDGYNLIIEGTLRNPQVPIRTCQELKVKGYSAELVVVACNAELAWKSTLARAEMQKEHGQIPRLVPIDIYNNTVHQIPDSLDTIEKTGCFDHITVQTRDLAILFSSDRESDDHASAALRKELDLPGWDSRLKEYERDFMQRKIEILSDRIKDMGREDYDER